MKMRDDKEKKRTKIKLRISPRNVRADSEVSRKERREDEREKSEGMNQAVTLSSSIPIWTAPFTITAPLWSRTVKNTDLSTGPLAHPFARLLATLTGSLAPDCTPNE